MDSPESQPEPEQQELLSPRPMAIDPLVILELQQQTQDLKRLFNATFVALIVLALGVNLFMWKETRIVRRDIGEKSPFLLAECETFRKFREPEIRKFLSELHLYASTHRDFQTNILERYRSLMPQYFSVPIVVSPAANNLPARPPGR